MHKLNVLILGPESFVLTLDELKPYLKFNIFKEFNNQSNVKVNKYDVLLFHKKALENKHNNHIIKSNSLTKILATANFDSPNFYDGILKLPTTLDEVNSVIESSVAKKVFNKNSSIKIKDFLLDKNEKKLIKDDSFIILTEKEIQLLELFLESKKPISKNKILSLVWNYSADADTHTVETHIYRLRKKISDKFSNEVFIQNNKEGYYF
jgi:DNA-binding response OmpR family regulator|tara:strand:+ start:2932 stop:3555 length:624 start_codon:yes stop_codon:yes gene_type:complete